MANKKLKTIQFPSLPDTYTIPQVENGANNNVALLDGAGNVKDSVIEASKVAKTDGSYQNLNAGTADQLNASVGVTDKVPYIFRTSGGSADIGHRLNDKIVGGTIVWNQLAKAINSSNYTQPYPRIVYTFENDLVTMTSMENYYQYAVGYEYSLLQGHKYFIVFSSTDSKQSMGSVITYNGSEMVQRFNDLPVVDDITSMIISITSSADSIRIGRYSSDHYNATVTVSSINIFDLTQMFGSAIADYIYSLEQATAKAGVAWFKNLFPKPYYEYNAGELMSVCTNAHITRGFNAYDSVTEMAKLVGGKQYQITGAFSSLAYSTGETITPDTNGLFTPTKNGVLTVTGGNSSTTCVHLTWSGYRNGEYEPYVEHRYPLSPIELRGIPKFDASNSLYFDGDTYEKDGTVTRKYGIVDLGMLDWNYDSTLSHERFVASVDGIKLVSGSVKGNLVCSKYTTVSADDIYLHTTDKTIAVHDTIAQVWVYDTAYTDTATFKAAMSGVYLVYELATPATETANPFADPQIGNDFGTEEYVDALATTETSPRDVEVPVGHETFYQANLRDKLQNLPANANADGLYLVKQTGNKQELIAYTPENELPTSPAETGTYILKLVDGALTWVLES